MQLEEERFPKDLGTRLAIADYYEKLGLNDKAAAANRQILTIDPENTTAKKRMRTITGETSASP